jgi:hypothetical protein
MQRLMKSSSMGVMGPPANASLSAAVYGQFGLVSSAKDQLLGSSVHEKAGTPKLQRANGKTEHAERIKTGSVTVEGCQTTVCRT